MTRGIEPGTGISCEQIMGTAFQPADPGGARREVGVEVVGDREDGPHDLRGLDPVPLADLPAQLDDRVLDGLDRVLVDLGGPADASHGGPVTIRDAPGRVHGLRGRRAG